MPRQGYYNRPKELDNIEENERNTTMNKLDEYEEKVVLRDINIMLKITQGVYEFCGGYGQEDLAKIEGEILSSYKFMMMEMLSLMTKRIEKETKQKLEDLCDYTR